MEVVAAVCSPDFLIFEENVDGIIHFFIQAHMFFFSTLSDRLNIRLDRLFIIHLLLNARWQHSYILQCAI